MRHLRRLAAWFWRRSMLFCFRKYASATPGELTAIPYLRERSDPCVAFQPRPPRPGEWAGCAGDGNALCRICCRHEGLRQRIDEVSR